MQPIHVVVAELPTMLIDIIRQIISSEPGIELVEAAGGDLVSAIRDARADVLVTASLPSVEPVARMLRANPRLRVIAVAGAGHTGWLWELRPHRESLGELSADVLINALRRPGTSRAMAQSEGA